METTFRINRKYENIEPVRKVIATREMHPRRRRRLGHALGFFNGGNTLRFYFNLIFR